MIPHRRAADWHRKRSPIPFGEIISHHSPGFLLSTPTLFLLARRLDSSRPPADFSDPRIHDTAGDTLHIWLVAGSIDRALIRALVPRGIRHLSWHRGPHLIRFPFSE